MGRDCKYCGAYIADSLTVCPSCGKKVRPEKKPEYDTYDSHSGAAAEESGWGGYDYGRSEDYSHESREEDHNDRSSEYRYTYERDEGCGADDCWAGSSADSDAEINKGISVLCYFGPLFLIPYLTRRNSDFVRFHSNQGLLLLLANIVMSVIGWEGIGAIYTIYCMVKGIKSVIKGEKKEIPFIGSIRLLK